jgi:AraC family transcriptional regulator
MLYFNKLPNHNDKRFDEQSHFASFQKQNIVFNAETKKSHCDEHVGCLSIKTVWSGDEAYRFQGVLRNVTPGQFLILNNDQRYSSSIDSVQNVKSMSVFFTNEFSAGILRDVQTMEQTLTDNYDQRAIAAPEFFQQLYPMDSTLESMLKSLAVEGESRDGVDEQLQLVLSYLLATHQSEVSRSRKVDAVKAATQKEIYRRLCVAKDVLHSSYHDDLDLATISHAACMSVPQLVRQFKIVFKTTPHQYLKALRISNAAKQLKNTDAPVQDIALACGFENVSAFCRAFKIAYNATPQAFRLG